jgi:hypothetical protein
MTTGIIVFTFICCFIINIVIARHLSDNDSDKWSARVVLLSWTGPIIPAIGLGIFLGDTIPLLFREAFPSKGKFDLS